MSDRTLVASVANLLAKGFQAVPTDRKGNALFAVARALHRVIAFKAPARAVAVIDAAAAERPWPALLTGQLPQVPALFAAHGIEVVTAPDEAHVVASYAQAALDAGDDVIVVGTDKRFAQLVSDRLWWYDANKDARYTPEMVVKRFTVGPDKVAAWLALVGDDESLPGVDGIGAKGATTLIETYGSVDGALAAPPFTGRLGKAVAAGRDAIPRELARARLDRTRALPRPLGELAYRPPAAASLNALYAELGFAELLTHDGAAAVEVALLDDAALAALPRDRPIAVYGLWEDPTPIRGALAGIALAAGDGRALYAVGAPTPALAAWLASDAAKVGHDLKSTEVALRRLDVRVGGIAGDSQCASHLMQSSNWAPHDLPLVARQVLGRALPDEDSVRGTGGQRKAWAQIDRERVAAYAGKLADAAAAAWQALAPQVDAKLMTEYLALSELLIDMELAGIGVDPHELDGAETDFTTIEAELQQQIEALAGKSFNIGSTKQLGQVLFEDLKLPIVSHTKTGWSVATEALERIEHAHPIVPLVIRHRLLKRMRDTWITALRKCIDPDGRVRSWFHPARSFTGRLVNSNPDLGRVPGRTPEMQRIRRAFVAREGSVLMSVDYNQLGLHVLAHMTKDPALVEPLRERRDVHALTAATILAKPLADVTPDDRQLGKIVNFATFAGQGASALGMQLGISAQQARDMIDRFYEHYRIVRVAQDEQFRLANELGYITTIAGRRWPIGGLESLDSELKSYADRLARRAPYEGSVSDVSRRGLLDAATALRAAGLRAMPVLQILDEVLFEVPEEEIEAAARIAADAMRDAFALEAPLRVGVEVGKNWADLAPLR